MIYQIRHYHGPAVTTDRIRAFKAIGKTLRRINFGGRTDVSGLDRARGAAEQLVRGDHSAMGHG